MSAFLEILLWPFSRLGRSLSRGGRMRRNAANWLELADRVWHYRRDRLTGAEAAELNRRRDELRQQLAPGADGGKLKLAIEALEAVLQRVGGAIYPKSSLAENIEFLVVAAIVIFGIRTYFVQPFEIPTNSMWPSYYGMTAENFPPGGPAPGPIARLWRVATLWAWPIEVDAPRSGAVSALFFGPDQLAYTVKDARTWLVFPTQVREYTLYVDGEPATVQVPLDFSGFDDIVIDTYFGGRPAFADYWRRLDAAGGLESALFRVEDGRFARVYRVPLNRTVQAREPLARFDLLTGDKLLVDRFSYHFVRPQPGAGMVFRTVNIPAIGQDEYYIKRLVGLPGDTIEIKEPVVYRNGRPITGAAAFALNAGRVPPYRGYFNGPAANGARYLLFPGQSLTVPPHFLFGLGDNSADSADGRYWGFVPEKDLVGRPLFIYYPFTRRWGPAK